MSPCFSQPYFHSCDGTLMTLLLLPLTALLPQETVSPCRNTFYNLNLRVPKPYTAPAHRKHLLIQVSWMTEQMHGVLSVFAYMCAQGWCQLRENCRMQKLENHWSALFPLRLCATCFLLKCKFAFTSHKLLFKLTFYIFPKRIVESYICREHVYKL